MAFSTGTRLGTFEVTGTLGAGGMGEVYRATDTKLGREVAIKTLPAQLAADKERLARFEREAKLLAGINHAHIASVYSLDEHAGTLYLAMELVEGETLEKKLEAGPLPVEEALRLALQIAEALEAAHEKGVVHRDLKPANIMIATDEQVKVLDFGLAKAFSTTPEGHPGHSPALSIAMTQAGLVLGTAGYMAPEQASGQPTDQRADVWAFGVVLYEMLTGLPLFSGESVPHILAEVLKTEPDWRRLPKNLHPRIRQLLERCLTKKPRNRLHSIADARVEIEAVLDDPLGVTPKSTAKGTSDVLRLASVAAAAAVVAGTAGWLLHPAPPPAPESGPGPIVRVSIPLGDGQRLSARAYPMVALSPDGTRIAYVANGQIFLRDLAESEARPVPGTAETGFGAVAPTFSPDGEWLAYVHAPGVAGPFTVKRVPISGGAPVSVYSGEGVANFPQGLTWPEPDTMLLASEQGILRITTNGGAPEVLVPTGEDERFFSPQILPGGAALLFTRAPGRPGTAGGLDKAQVVVQSIGGNDRTVVWEGGSAARYLPSGHLVYAQGTALFAVPFDPRTRAVRGGPVPVLDGVHRSSNGIADTANYAVSDTGTLVMIPGDPNAVAQTGYETTLVWVDRAGREEPFPVRPGDYVTARISPDGTKVALVVGSRLFRGRPPAIWVFDLPTETLSLLTANPGGDDSPLWSADGTRIFFRSFGTGTGAGAGAGGIYAIDVDTRETTLVAASPDFPLVLPRATSRDGGTLGLVDPVTLTDFNIATLTLADGKLTRVLDTATVLSEPSFSPNGMWLAYHEERQDGTAEISIRPFPAVLRTQIPVGAGTAPVFSPDGSELFFRQGNGLSVVAVAYEPTLSVGAPVRFFDSSAYLWAADGRSWDVDSSGERFLMIRAPGSTVASAPSSRDQIDVVINWVEELERRVPVD